MFEKKLDPTETMTSAMPAGTPAAKKTDTLTATDQHPTGQDQTKTGTTTPAQETTTPATTTPITTGDPTSTGTTTLKANRTTNPFDGTDTK